MARAFAVGAAAALLAGCAAGAPETAGPAAGVDPGAAACGAAVAAHVGKPVEAVAVTTVEAGAVYEARDAVAGGARLHVCEFDDAGRLAALIHPGA